MDIRDLRAPLSFIQQIDMKFIRRYGTSTKFRPTSKQGWGKWFQADSLFLIYSGSDDILHNFMARGGGTNETAARKNIEALELGLEKVGRCRVFATRNSIVEDVPLTTYSCTTLVHATFSY